MFETIEEFTNEYNRLFAWRDLWTRLANRKKTKGSANAIFLSTLQIRDERIQARAWKKNLQISALMKQIDAWNHNNKIAANRKFFLAELRSGKYVKGTIFSDEKTGKPLFPPDFGKEGSCACAVMHDLFYVYEGKKSGRNYLQALDLTPDQCRFIQQKLNDTVLTLPEIADWIEMLVFNSQDWKKIKKLEIINV